MNLVKTTITITEDILMQAKMSAVLEKTTVSELIRRGLKHQLSKRKYEKSKDPMKLLGKFSLGITKIYNKRSDLYEDHLKRKMGY